MSRYVYIRSEPGLSTTGFYDPAGKWHTDEDYSRKEEAADRVAYLNGSGKPTPEVQKSRIEGAERVAERVATMTNACCRCGIKPGDCDCWNAAKVEAGVAARAEVERIKSEEK